MTSSQRGMRTRIALCVAAVVALSAGLGVGVIPASSQSSPTVTLPPLDPAARVALAETCPGSSGQLTDEQFKTVVATQALLLPTLGAVQTYAKPQLSPSEGTRVASEDLANPSSEFGSIGIGGPWDRQVVFIQAIGTNENRQRHADALTKLVPRPDRVVVCPTAVSEARRADITNALNARFRGPVPDLRFYGTDAFTPTGGRVPVHLRSDAAALAKELQTTYNTDIAITLGNFSWPDAADPGAGPDLAARCGTVPANKSPRIDWSRPKGITVRSGETFDLSIKVRNPSKQTIEFTQFKAVITPRGKRTVIANRAQVLFYPAVQSYLPPGAWETLRIFGGTDACNASSGWALKPGRYDIYLVNALPSPGVATFTSPPIPLTVK